MKKYYFIIIVALILGLVLTGCTLLSNIGQAPATEQSGITYLTKGLSSDDLVGLWHFDEGTGTTAKDSTTNNNDGTLLPTGLEPSWTTDSKFGLYALSFDGSDDWVDIPDLSITGDFSIEFWVNLDPGIGNQDAVVGQEGSGQDINFYASKCRWFTAGEDGFPWDAIIANTPAQSSTWEYYAITRSGDTLTLYRNGVADATNNISGINTLPFHPMAIGRGNAGYFGGLIDEVRIWDGVLTAGQIEASYNGGLRKELDRTTANLGDHVGVTLDVVVALTDPPVTVVDTLPSELRYIPSTFEVDGNPAIPTVDGQEISYNNLGFGAYTITFDAQVTSVEAEAATPNTVTNEATADGASASAELTINPYDGFTKEAELLSTEDDDMIIEVGEEIEWKVTITVTNIPDEIASMNNIVVQDRFGGELEIDNHLVSGSGSLEVKTFGKTKKPKIKWDGFSLLVDGASEKADLFVFTDENPGGQHSYSTAGEYEMNSGAVLKFTDSGTDGTGFQLSAHTPQITVVVNEP